jgi:hypothetical protein
MTDDHSCHPNAGILDDMSGMTCHPSSDWRCLILKKLFLTSSDTFHLLTCFELLLNYFLNHHSFLYAE